MRGLIQNSSVQFPPELDLIAPAIGIVGLVAAGIDAGGPVDKTTDAFPGYGELAPQAQVCRPGR